MLAGLAELLKKRIIGRQASDLEEQFKGHAAEFLHRSDESMEPLPPILEFDPDREAIIEPSKANVHRDVPERCVICFFREVIENVSAQLNLQPLAPFNSEMGTLPIWSATHLGSKFGVMQIPVGAPLAAGMLEEVIARGGRKFVACGGAGVLDKTIASGDIIVPTSALRDEGTSYHYLPPAREVAPTERVVKALMEVLHERACRHVMGKTWTTDGFYRETRGRIARRREEGCIAVEMEASALFAVAQFRGVEIGMLLYGGDDVTGIEWDPREFGQKIPAREKLFWLAVEACVRL
jgi:uridine phosphorylase